MRRKMKSCLWASFAIVVGALAASWRSGLAVPACPELVIVTQPDGEKIVVTGHGDEWFHWTEDKDGYAIVKGKDGFWEYATAGAANTLVPNGIRVREHDLADAQAFKSTTQRGLPRALSIPPRPPLSETRSLDDPPTLPATYNLLLILIDFPDLPHTQTPASFDNMMNSSSWSSGPSFRQYYLANSYGQFTTNAFVTEWYTAFQDHAHYGCQASPDSEGFIDPNQCDNGRAEELVGEALYLADPDWDFSAFDNNGDGFADGIFVVHAGEGCEIWPNDSTNIWSHSGDCGPVHRDGVWIRHYTIEPELQYGGHSQIGVFAHEYGHALGLPDLYDTDYYGSQGLGRWSLMAGGSWNGSHGSLPSSMDPWCKTFLNYLTPIPVTDDVSGQAIQASELNPNVFLLQGVGMSGSEYFLIENRHPDGDVESLPGSGLLIYHVDDSQGDNTHEWYPGHENSGHYKIALEQADGNWDLEQDNNSGNTGDPFPGTSNNHWFDWNSTPSSLGYSSASSGVSIGNISSPMPTMTADLSVGESVVFVNGSASSNGDGSLYHPFRTIQWGVDHVPTGGAVAIFPGAYAAPTPVDRAMSLINYNPGGGLVTIGQTLRLTRHEPDTAGASGGAR